MSKNWLRYLILALLVFITLFVGYKLRLNHYADVPFAGESRDEFSFAWLGLSLLQTGRPVATSGIEGYTHVWKYINVSNIFQSFANPNPFPIDTPWFDHPPLFGLVPGGYAYIKGVRQFADAQIGIIRRPMLWLGVINIFLIFILTSLVINKKVGLMAALIYATDPLVVISSRMVQAENLIVSFFLVSLIFYFLFYKVKKNYLFWLTISLAGAATLVKLSGISIALALVIITLILEEKNKFGKALLIVVGVFLIFLLFPLYGFAYNWPLFKTIFLTNSSRYFRDGLAGFYLIIAQTNITRSFFDGWIMFGWFSIFFLVSKIKKESKLWWIVVPVISYLFVYLIFGSEGYGWYKIPFYPFLMMSVAWIFNWALQNESLLVNLFSILIIGGTMLNKFIKPENIKNNFWLFRFSLLLIFSCVFLPNLPITKNIKILSNKIVTWIIFFFLIGLNLWINSKITIDLWYKIE